MRRPDLDTDPTAIGSVEECDELLSSLDANTLDCYTKQMT